MKARIVTKISERVLLFAIDNTVKAKLDVILTQLDIQSHTVTCLMLYLLRQKGYCACVACQVNVLTD